MRSFINRRTAIASAIIGLLLFFLQFKEFELYWDAVFCSYFSMILKLNGVVVLVTPKQEVEQKTECFCSMTLFRSDFKVEWENSVWTKISFLFGGFFVHMRQFVFCFHCFFFDLLTRFFCERFCQSIHSPFWFFIKLIKIIRIVGQDFSCYVFRTRRGFMIFLCLW